MEMKDIICYRRSELKLTLEDIAKRVGVSRSTVQRWENGEIKNLGKNRIASLAAVLQVSPEYLLGWSEDPAIRMGEDLAAAVADLTDEEIASLLNYIDFLKTQRRKRK